jgi:hypothetical protein
MEPPVTPMLALTLLFTPWQSTSSTSHPRVTATVEATLA